MKNKITKIKGLIPGIILLFTIGLIGWFIGEQIPYISYLLICIIIGISLSNTIGLPRFFEKGIQKTYKIWLETGIMILGARIVFAELIGVGPTILLLVIFFLVFSLLFTHYLASKIGLKQKMASLLASGVSVCGVSAIVATGGGIRAKEKQIAYAIAAILVFDIITVFAWPAIGSLFEIPSQIFGPWAGLTSPSTGTTVAIGFIHSETAGELATMTKLARNVFIGVWALLFAIYYANKGIRSQIENKGAYFWDKFPKFILGFLLTIVLANIGVFSEAQIQYLENAYSWLFMMAFVGLGYNIKVKELLNTGLKPLIVTTTVFIIVSILSLAMLFAIF